MKLLGGAAPRSRALMTTKNGDVREFTAMSIYVNYMVSAVGAVRLNTKLAHNEVPEHDLDRAHEMRDAFLANMSSLMNEYNKRNLDSVSLRRQIKAKNNFKVKKLVKVYDEYKKMGAIQGGIF